MPQLPGTRTLIQLDLSDRVFHSTRFKQRATFTELRHVQDPFGVCTAYITVRVEAFSDDAGKYGESLALQGVPDRLEELRAANDTLVDATAEAGGTILAIRTTETPAEWEALVASFAQPTMLQGDFFEYLRENQALNIGELIRHHIQQADAMGRFA